ncbi:RNA polymerase sigma factor [Paenibacillus amylolyticus]|uniref:RNA polymerase sigma factor n=1 Tax=Paenibacillus amylolyticus TaxID=1451 RepID=A0A5M9WSL8_PAEAM|nr:RNA polymerase sigma factor [Paenibacillus amylolyticus]KAA8784469.1 RNA polymerase sigma factor [Paenibacillus amylolyticus]
MSASFANAKPEIESATNIIEKLYRENYLSMKQKAYYMTHDASTAEDLVQESFVRLFDKKQTLLMLAADQQYCYMVRTVHNVTLNYVEKQKKKRRWIHIFNNENDMDNILDVSPIPEQCYERKEQSKWMEQLLKSLPRRDQQLLRNKYLLGLADKESAHLLGLAEANISTSANYSFTSGPIGITNPIVDNPNNPKNVTIKLSYKGAGIGVTFPLGSNNSISNGSNASWRLNRQYTDFLNKNGSELDAYYL